MKIGRIENIVPVIADGGIADPLVSHGRMIPVLVVDCEHHSALIDLCHIHKNTPPGDVVSTWVIDWFDKQHIYLQLNFVKPIKTTASLKFGVRKQGGLIYGIMAAHGFYFQPSSFAPKVSQGLDKPKILIEVHSQVTPPNWDSIYEKQLVKRYKSEGYDRIQARQAAKQHVDRAKEFWLIGKNTPPKN